MFAALITFSLGVLVVLAARPLSNHYAMALRCQRLIPTYAFFQAAGHITGLAVFLALTPAEFRSLYLLLICSVLFPASALSARVVCGITDYWLRFRRDPVGFILHADRYSAFGGLSGALVTFAAAVAIFRVPFGFWVADAFCFGLLAGEIVSRLGCHANGCCYGKPVRAARGVARLLSVVYRDELQKAVWHGGFGGEPIYAAPLCIGLLNLIVICLLLIVADTCNPPAGLLGGIGLMLYPYCRLVNDFLRVDRHGAGKTFTFLFLPLLFGCGFWFFVASVQTNHSPRPFADFAALAEPRVWISLVVEYLLLLLAYAWGVEFSRKEGVRQDSRAGEALVGGDTPVVQPE